MHCLSLSLVTLPVLEFTFGTIYLFSSLFAFDISVSVYFTVCLVNKIIAVSCWFFL